MRATRNAGSDRSGRPDRTEPVLFCRRDGERVFNPRRWQIITAGQADIGMLDVDYRPGTAAALRAVSWAKVPGVVDVILLRDGLV